MLKHPLKDSALRRLFKNAGLLITGDAIASGFGFASLALSARALGLETFGALALIQSYVLIVDRLVNFQSWQAVIRYGAEKLESKQINSFKELIKFGFTLDVSTALLGAVIAVAAAPLIGRWGGWSEDVIHLAIIYSGIIFFRIIGTPTAVIRLYDRFKLFSIQKSVAGAVKFCAVCIAYALKADLWAFVLIWGVTDIIGNVLLILMSLKELHRNNIRGFWRSKLVAIGTRFPGLLKFAWTTNIDSIVRVGRQMDILIIGKMLGFESVALYKVARQLANLILKVVDPFYSAVYPPLSRFVATKNFESIRSTVMSSSIILGLVTSILWVLFVLGGSQGIEIVFGARYTTAYPIAVWCLLGVAFWGFSQPFAPAMLAMGKAKTNYYIHLVNTIIYLISLVLLSSYYGVVGSGVAYLIFNLTWSLSIVSAYLHVFKPHCQIMKADAARRALINITGAAGE